MAGNGGFSSSDIVPPGSTSRDSTGSSGSQGSGSQGSGLFAGLTVASPGSPTTTVTPIVSNRQVVSPNNNNNIEQDLRHLSLPLDKNNDHDDGIDDGKRRTGTPVAPESGSPVTDKLLGILDKKKQPSLLPKQETVPPAAPRPPPETEKQEEPIAVASSSYGTFFGSWWGGSTSTTSTPASSDAIQPKQKEEETEKVYLDDQDKDEMDDYAENDDADKDVALAEDNEPTAIEVVTAETSEVETHPAVAEKEMDDNKEDKGSHESAAVSQDPSMTNQNPIFPAPSDEMMDEFMVPQQQQQQHQPLSSSPPPPQSQTLPASREEEGSDSEVDGFIMTQAAESEKPETLVALTDQQQELLPSGMSSKPKIEREEDPGGDLADDEDLTQTDQEDDYGDEEDARQAVAAGNEDPAIAIAQQAILEAEKALAESSSDDDDLRTGVGTDDDVDTDKPIVSAPRERSSGCRGVEAKTDKGPPTEVTVPDHHETELRGGKEPTMPTMIINDEEDRKEPAVVAVTGSTPAMTIDEEKEEEVTISRKTMDPKDQKALDDAFVDAPVTPATTKEAIAGLTKQREGTTPLVVTTTATKSKKQNQSAAAAAKPKQQPTIPIPTDFTPLPRIRGLGTVHPDTPVPKVDVCLRLLRKFARKTRPRILTTYGGSKPLSLYGYFFAREDPTFVPYKLLMDILFEGRTEHAERHPDDELLQDDSETENIVHGIMGEQGDTMDRARRALAAFCFTFSSWGHASAHLFENKDVKTREQFSDLLAAVFNAACTLVAHGCLDHVIMLIGDSPQHREAMPVTNLLTQSVLAADLNPERNELAAMKFLLSAGCRNYDNSYSNANSAAMLGGSHLLQTIRMLYHIFLTTESINNKVTARAALQQLVTHVFGRMAAADRLARSDPQHPLQSTSDGFPSDHHRNAFLVLRAICKLSMRTLPDGALHAHIGFQSSGSNETWDGHDESATGTSSSISYDNAVDGGREHAQLIYTAAIHPALESKILALDLLHYVLAHTEFPPGFIQRSGPQFHAAIRNYLCVSLLKNCTSSETHVVNLSLRIFVPLMRNFRTILKNEIEAFVTNVFFVILDSPNSSADHKGIVVRTFDEICSDPVTLAEIFLNYDCDLSAVDLFHRIVNTLSRVSRTGLYDVNAASSSSFWGGSSQRQEKIRFETRELRLDAMKALRQVLASLHASIAEPMPSSSGSESREVPVLMDAFSQDSSVASPSNASHNPVEVYGSKKKRRQEESEAILRFNQKPSAGIAFAAKCGHIQGDDPADVARYLLKLKDALDKTMIGEYLGREAEYQEGFSIRVLHEYVRLFDFTNLALDDAIRYFLSGFRLPGEAQKIDRIMEKFAERFTEQNPALFPTADVAFVLSFSIIMLNTDLHNPAIKEERRMTKEGFIRNNRGICDGQDLPEELLSSIFDRIRVNPISLKEDDEARQREAGRVQSRISPASFFSSHYDEIDRARESNFRKEREHIVRTTESLLKRRRHHGEPAASKSSTPSPAKDKTSHPKTSRLASQRFVRTEDSGLRDEYVAPMFEVTWGPALAAFSTAMESANGTMGALINIATDEELEIAAENAAETIEVCLTGFRFAICTGGLCGNDVARDSYMLALSRFSQLGSGTLLEPRHVRCIQTLLSIAREDGELLGTSWQYVFRALSEVNRFHQLFHLMARNDRAAAAAAARRRKRLEARESRRKARRERRAALEESDSLVAEADWDDLASVDGASEIGSLAESDIFLDEDFDIAEEDMDAKAVDEANARLVYDGVSEDVIEVIYERSSSLSTPAIEVFVSQLCYVSSMEISVGYGSSKDLNQVSYRQQHALMGTAPNSESQFHHRQPNIYNLQKLVEVAHYNMESRSRLVFADLWGVIAEHLTQTALHKNPALAMYAVDSFRQLSIQFLQREELEAFEFQRRFLKPLEKIMAQSKQNSTKELLLNCVARVIQVYDDSNQKGGLRSGWVPLLTILGLGGRDPDADIARLSANILYSQVKQCTDPKRVTSSVLLTEHFTETVDALFTCTAGSHLPLALEMLDACRMLASYLDNDILEPPHLKQRTSTSMTGLEPAVDTSQHLEHWWPLLIGISQTAGDEREEVRHEAMKVLFGIIDAHFFPVPTDGEIPDDAVQRLQLVFRGILTPMLEFAEVGDDHPPRLPKDMDRFVTAPPPKIKSISKAEDGSEPTSWLKSMFDLFMDACISLCKRAAQVYQTTAMVEEVFAILNHCLVSDSGALAVRGIDRLEQFVTSDLDPAFVTQDVWATVCHMLRRCLQVRGLPRSDPEITQEDYAMDVREFVTEEKLLANRRYVGGNAIMAIGNLLSSERLSQAMGFSWNLFLIKGLGRGVVAFEDAAELLAEKADNRQPLGSSTQEQPPNYIETAHYGRKWMNRFIIQLASMEEVAHATSNMEAGEYEDNLYLEAQKLVIEETENLLLAFVEKEQSFGERPSELDAALHIRFSKLARELVEAFTYMRHEHVRKIEWLKPVLLSSCIQSKNAKVLAAIRKFVHLIETEPQPEVQQEETSPASEKEPAQLSAHTNECEPGPAFINQDEREDSEEAGPERNQEIDQEEAVFDEESTGLSNPAAEEEQVPAFSNHDEGEGAAPEGSEEINLNQVDEDVDPERTQEMNQDEAVVDKEAALLSTPAAVEEQVPAFSNQDEGEDAAPEGSKEPNLNQVDEEADPEKTQEMDQDEVVVVVVVDGEAAQLSSPAAEGEQVPAFSNQAKFEEADPERTNEMDLGEVVVGGEPEDAKVSPMSILAFDEHVATERIAEDEVRSQGKNEAAAGADVDGRNVTEGTEGWVKPTEEPAATGDYADAATVLEETSLPESSEQAAAAAGQTTAGAAALVTAHTGDVEDAYSPYDEEQQESEETGKDRTQKPHIADI